MKYSLLVLGGGLLFLMGAGCNPATTTDLYQYDTDQNSSGTELPDGGEQTEGEETNQIEPMNELAHPGVLPDEKIANKQIRLETEKGTIVFKLFNETAPLTVSNFVYLAEQGYYDELTFHRVVEDFVIQGGDPTGTGRGGPGYRFEDEVGADHVPAEVQAAMNADANRSLYQRGLVAMANAGPDTNGSQFFIMLDNIPSANMPNLYSIFGQVTEGIEIIDTIEMGDKMLKVTVETIGGEPATAPDAAPAVTE